MTTPSYLGAGQPIAKSGGLLARISSYLGGGETPSYAGGGQPSSAKSGLLATAAPAYAAAPVRAPIAQPQAQEMAASCGPEERPVVMCPIDPEALAAGQIAIVIPHQGT